MKKLLVFLSLLVMVVFVAGCETPQTGAVEGITITSEENVRTIKVNETLQLTAKAFPASAEQSVVWSTEDENIASVSEEGLVTGVAKGNVNIVATSTEDETVSKSFALIVEEAEEQIVEPTSVEVTGNTTCKAGETLTLSAVVSPAEASQSVTWVSSDTSVATVSRGEVTALKEGTVVITVFAKGYENVSTSITLTIEPGDAPSQSKEWSEMEYTTHEAYMSAEKETPLKVKGVVTHVSPVKDGKVTYVLQNGTEGYYVYAQDAASFPVELGKVYEVGGFKKYYQGLNEIVDVEYFNELEEKIEYTVNSLEGLNPTDLTAMEPYHCSVVTGTALFENGTVNAAKAYSFYATVNGHSTTFRVDPSYMSAEEYAEINKKIAAAVSGASFEFTGIMSAFGYGKASPQILITKAENLVFAEMSVKDLLKAAAASVKISSSVAFSVNEIALPTTVEGFDDLVIAWASNSELINAYTGTVTHAKEDTVVTLTAQFIAYCESYTTEFEVLVFAADETVYETVASLDLEDALAAGSYGNSETKSSYADGNVFLGGHTWMLRNALIGGTASDIREGTFSIRAQVGKDEAATGRVEIKEDVEFSVLEFAVATYGNDADGVQIRIEYSKDSGATWEAHETVISVDSSDLLTYRVKLPEGVNRVAMVLVVGTGKRVNLDNIKLLK